MKLGDLVEFSGEYHRILGPGRMEWTVSKLKKAGLITDIDQVRLIIVSGDEEYIVAKKSVGVICAVEVISDV